MQLIAIAVALGFFSLVCVDDGAETWAFVCMGLALFGLMCV